MRNTYYGNVRQTQYHGRGMKTRHYKVQHGDGIADIFRAIGKSVMGVVARSGLKETGKRVARQTFDSVKTAGTKYIQENKGEILNKLSEVGSKVGKIATEELDEGISDLIRGEPLGTTIKKRGRRVGERSKKKVMGDLEGMAQTQRRKLEDIARGEQTRAKERAKEGLKESVSKIEEEMPDQSRALFRKLFLGGGHDMGGSGMRRLGVKGKGMRQLGTGAKKRGRPRKKK